MRAANIQKNTNGENGGVFGTDNHCLTNSPF